MKRDEAILRLRSLLAQLARPPKIAESAWTLLQSVVAEESAFLRLVMTFEWAVDQPGLDQTEAEIRSILARRGYARDEMEAGFVCERLVTYVFRRLSRKGRAPLTAADLTHTCAQTVRTTKDDDLITLIRAHIAETNARLREVESAVAEHSTELSSLQQAMKQINQNMGLVAAFSISEASFSTEVPAPVSPRVSRSRVIQSIHEHVERLSAAVLVGEPGSGKTQLLLLLQERDARRFCWLNIPRDASEARACILLDAFIRSLSPNLASGSYRESLNVAAGALRNATVAIEDLPRILPGGRLAARISQLYDALSDGRLLASSYYRLPDTLEERLGDVHCVVPRFNTEDLIELLEIAGAPDTIRIVVEYWMSQAEQVTHPFRTAQSHTLRQLDLSDGTINGTRKLLSAMRFCLGADLAENEMSWLDFDV